MSSEDVTPMSGLSRKLQMNTSNILGELYTVEDARHIIERLELRCKNCYDSGTKKFEVTDVYKDAKELNRIVIRNLLIEGGKSTKYYAELIDKIFQTRVEGKIAKDVLTIPEQYEFISKSVQSMLKPQLGSLDVLARISGWVCISTLILGLPIECYNCYLLSNVSVPESVAKDRGLPKRKIIKDTLNDMKSYLKDIEDNKDPTE
jgi:hypothetical protein